MPTALTPAEEIRFPDRCARCGGKPETTHQLEPGGSLVLYSDGVTEAQNEDGEEFGDERLLEVLRGGAAYSPDEVIDQVIHAIDQFAGAAAQFDDITLMIVRRR